MVVSRRMRDAARASGDPFARIETWPRWLPPLLVALAAIACYAATLAYGFAYDDKQLPMSPLLARPFDFLAVLRNEY